MAFLIRHFQDGIATDVEIEMDSNDSEDGDINANVLKNDDDTTPGNIVKHT